ncbi:MAG: DivIVA domain-containing protein [Bacilli bacterium]|nr:DivIVA domain-containing protein [Bacilli bacterium]
MKKFSTSLNGYSKLEVNNFVVEVTNNYEAVLNRLKEADREIEKLKTDLVRYKSLENTLNKAIIIANDTANQIRRSTKDEAENIINEARKNASRIVNDALIKAEKAENDAETLKRRVEIYKRRITQIMDEQKEMIESMDIDY